MRRLVLVFLLTAAMQPLHAQVTRGGSLPGALPLFPSDNWWNVDITEAPVDPKSSAFISFIGATRSLHPDLGGDAEPDPLIYGMPYIIVPGSQPRVPVEFYYPDESDYQAPGLPLGYPIPAEAKTGTKWIEGGLPGNDLDADGDRHMLIVDRDNRVLHELYDLHWNESEGSWQGGSGAIFDLDSNNRRPEGWTSADAAGLAILPGLIRYDEAFGSEPIRHAFRVTVRATNGYVYPASHRAGNTSRALPMGARLRLKASTNITGFPAEVRRIFQAMKTYGLIVADNGSDMYISGTYDTRWDNDVLNPAFRSLEAGDFEVIELGWKPSETPPCTDVRITMEPADVTIHRGESTTMSVAASGTAPLRYRWYEGNSGDRSNRLTGESGSSIVVTPEQTISYWVEVSNDCSTVESDEATVTVRPLRRRGARR